MSLMTWARVVKGGTPAAERVGEHPAAAPPADPLAAVRAQAEALLAQAQREAEELRTAGHAEGLARGLAEAEALVAQEIETQSAALAEARCAAAEARVGELLAELSRQHQVVRDQWLARWERGAVELAGELASRLLRRELAADASVRAELIRQALDLAAGNSAVRVWVHPADLSEVTGDCRGVGWQLLADNQLAPGDCRLEFPCGEIDARVRTQVRRLLDELLPQEDHEPGLGLAGGWWGGPA
ncbi:MAG: FliH/SctL family protein [Planctomycetaceae bacterium]